MSLRVILLVSCLLLSGLGFSLMQVMRGQAQQSRRSARLRQAADQGPLRMIVPQAMSLRAAQADRQPWHARLGRIFGITPARRAISPLPWGVVLLGAFGIGYVAGRMATGVAGTPGMLAWPLVFVFGPRWFFGMIVQRRRATLFRQFPDALAMIVRSVRAGIPVSEAIRAVARDGAAPTAQEFSQVASAIGIGVPLEEALSAMAERNDMPEYRFFATALSLQSQTGGGLSETLENLADVIRKRVAMKERGIALSAEARTSAIVLGVLPLFAGGALAVLDPAYIAVLFVDPKGHSVLGAAILSLGVGALVMKIMIQKSLS